MGKIKEKVETNKENTWKLWKEYDSKVTLNYQLSKVRLTNFISNKLEMMFSSELENLFREDWQEEVNIFCKKYSYDN